MEVPLGLRHCRETKAPRTGSSEVLFARVGPELFLFQPVGLTGDLMDLLHHGAVVLRTVFGSSDPTEPLTVSAIIQNRA